MIGKLITFIIIQLISLSFAYEGFRSNQSSVIWVGYCALVGLGYMYLCMKSFIQSESENG